MRYQYLALAVEPELPARQKALLEVRLRSIPGMVSAYIGAGGRLNVYYNGVLPDGRLQWELRQAGCRRTKKTAALSQVLVQGQGKETDSEFAGYRRDAILAGVGLAGWQILKRVSPGAFMALKLARSAFVLLVARKFIVSGIRSIAVERQPNADTLTTTAVLASVLSGRPESSLTLLALSNFAEMLTTYTAEKARRHISELMQLDQQFVWKVEADGHEQKVGVESLQPGDRIAVHLGEKICVDGRVLSGAAAVDQSSITGECIPVEKTKGAYVYAGTVVQNGYLMVLVEKVGDDTSLARIVHMVEEAQTRRAPVQNFADRMANMLVPISFLAAALVYGATRDWQRVLNMLFIDFSCGLKLSTATAISAAIGRAAKRGALIKGGNYVEALAGVDTVVLDKTGTITVGTPQIVAVKTVEGIRERDVLLLAAATEFHSAHPLAAAILNHVGQEGWEIPPHETTETFVARGIAAEVPDFEDVSGGRILVGSLRFMEEMGIAGWQQFIYSTDNPGFNLVYVARNEELIGLLIISDTIRPDFKKTLNQLRRQGIDEIVMITGDSAPVAKHVADALDLDAFHAEVLPEDKATLVTKLQRRSHVLMVGDGVNDAPALAFSDVGVAMGGRRTDIAVESAAITINSDDPLVLPEVLNLGRQTMQIVRENFTATIAVNTAAMLLGALGRTNPMVSALIHNAATIGVVLNSARILLPQQTMMLKPVVRKGGE